MGLLKEHDLRVIPLCFSDGFMCPGERFGHPDPWKQDVDSHFDVLKMQFAEILDSNVADYVSYINCHTGSDFFTKEESLRLFHLIDEFEKRVTTPWGNDHLI